MRNPFRRRRSSDSASQTEVKEEEEPKPTQEVFAQTSSTEFPALKKVSTIEVSTSTSLVDRKPSFQPSNLSRINEHELKDTAVNTSNTSFLVPSKDSKVFVSTSSQWEDNLASAGQKSSVDSPLSAKQSIQDGPKFKEATVQTSSTSNSPNDTHRYSFPEKNGGSMGKKSKESLPFGDKQEINSVNLNGLTLEAPAPLYVSSPRDEETKVLKVNKPVVVFPADKPGIFFMPGITNIPLMAPFPFPPFFPPPLLPPNPFPLPPVGIKSLPLIQPLRQTKEKVAPGPWEEAAASPVESSQDTSQTAHAGRRSLAKGVESHRKKDRGEDYNADFSSYLFKETRKREETDSYTSKNHENRSLADSMYSGDEVPLQNRTFICRKHRSPCNNQTYICRATDKSCPCQKDMGNFKQTPPAYGTQTTVCANCQCCYCCFPDGALATSRCGFAAGNVCDGCMMEDNLSHINASVFRRVQVSLRSSNKKRHPKVKKYNFNLDTIKMLGSLFSGARGTSLNCREVNCCRRRAECYCVQNRLVMDQSCSTTIHQIPPPCPCEEEPPPPCLKPKESVSSKFKSSSFGRHLKQLLTKFDRDLSNLPDRSTTQQYAETDECERVGIKVDGPCPNAESKCVDTEDNDIKCNSVPFTCGRRNTWYTFGDDDMFTSEKCRKAFNGCREIQDRCGYLACGKKNACDKMSSGRPDCDEDLIHCCGCKCECCRINSKRCTKKIKTHKVVCSTYSQTNTTSEKKSKNTSSEENEDSSQLFQPTVLKSSPPQEETHASTAVGEDRHSSTTEEGVDMGADLPKIDTNSDDTQSFPKPTITNLNDEYSDVLPMDQQQETINSVEQEIIPETEIKSTELKSYSKEEEDLSKPSDDINKEMNEQESDQEIIVKSAEESKIIDESPTFITDWKNDSQTPQRPYIDRCKDYQHQDVHTDYQSEPQPKENTTSQQQGSYEYNFKPSIFCAIKRKSANKKDIDYMEEYEIKRRDVCDEDQKIDTRHPCWGYTPQPPPTDTAEDVEPEDSDKAEENSTEILEPTSDKESSQVDDSELIVYAMSNNIFKDTADIKLFRSTYSSQGDSREQSTICNLPDLDSEMSEMKGQQDRLKDISQLLRMQSSTNNVSQSHDQSDILLHGHNEQAKRINTFTSKNNEQIKGNDTFTSKNGCQQVKRNDTFNRKNDNEEAKQNNTFTSKKGKEQVKRNNTFTCKKDNEKVKRNTIFNSKNDGQQIKRQNTFTCDRKQKHHEIESYVQEVPVSLEDNNTHQFPAGRCAKQHIQCTTKGDLVKPTHDSDGQITQDEQYTVTKGTRRSRKANQTPSPSIPSKTEEKTFQLSNVRRCKDNQYVEADIPKQDDSTNDHRCKVCQEGEGDIITQGALPNVRRCRDRLNVEVDNLKQSNLPNVHKSKGCENEEANILKQNNLPNVHRCRDCQDIEIDALKRRGLRKVRRCRDRQNEEADILKQDDYQLQNAHTYKDSQDDESGILKRRGLPNVRRCRDRHNDEVDTLKQDNLPNVHRCKVCQDDDIHMLEKDIFHLPNVHRCKDYQDDEVNLLKNRALPKVPRCRDRQNKDANILKNGYFQLPNIHKSKDRQTKEANNFQKDDFQLPNVHTCKDCQDDESDILKRHGLPNVRRCRDLPKEDVDILKQDNFPNVHRFKDFQDDEVNMLKKDDFQLPNVYTSKDCQDENVSLPKQRGLPNVRRCRDRKNNEDDILKQDEVKKPNVHKCRVCQDEDVDSLKQQELPNVHRYKDYQIDEVDILKQHELHIHKGYIYNRKHLNLKREHDYGKNSLFCTIKNKQAKFKGMDYMQEFEGSQHDMSDDNQQDEKHVDSSCRVCRSRSSSTVKTEVTQSSNIDKETEVTAEVSKKGLKSNNPSTIRKTVSSKAVDSVGIACHTSKSKHRDIAYGKQSGSAFSRKDNSQDQSTTCNLSDLDSEILETRVSNNLLKDISELLCGKTSTKEEDSNNPSYYDSYTGNHYFSNCFPTRCHNSILQCNCGSKMEENQTKNILDCSQTNLGNHLFVCQPCLKQFGPNHCCFQGKQHMNLNDPSNDCLHSDQCATCQCCRIEKCRSGRYFIVKSNSNTEENSQHISSSYFDQKEACLKMSSVSLNPLPNERVSFPHTLSTEHQLYFASHNTEYKKQQTFSPCGTYFGDVFNQLDPFIIQKLTAQDKVHSHGKKRRIMVEQREQENSVTISKIVTESKRIQLCLEQEYRYNNSYKQANNRKECRSVQNRKVAEPAHEEFSSNIINHTNLSRQGKFNIGRVDNKQSETDLEKTSCRENNHNEREFNNGIRTFTQILSELSKNDGKSRKSEVHNSVNKESSPSKEKLRTNIGSDSSPSKGELGNNIGSDSSPSKGELGNNIGSDSSPSKGELGNNIGSDSSPSKGELGNNIGSVSSPSKGELGNNIGSVSSPSKGELGNNIGSDSSPSKGELGNNIGSDSSPSKGELGNNIGSDSSPSKGELGNNIGSDSSPSKVELVICNISDESNRCHSELCMTSSNDILQSNKELTNSASIVSDISKQELSKTVSEDSNISKRKQSSSTICNHTKRSEREASSSASNRSNRNMKEKLKCPLSHSKPGKIHLDDSADKQNSEELNNMVISDNILNKQEEDNAGFPHDVRSHRNPSYTNFTHNERSHGDPSYKDFPNHERSQRDLRDTHSNHNLRSHRDPSCTYSNHDAQSHRDSSFTDSLKPRCIDTDPDVRDRDPNHINSNSDVRSHRDPSYIDSNYDVQSHRDPSYIDSNYDLQSHRDPSYIDSKYDVQSHRDPSYIDSKYDVQSHRDPSYIDSKYDVQSHGDPSYIDSKYDVQSHRDPSYIDSKYDVQSHRDPSYIDSKYDVRSRRNTNYIDSYRDVLRHNDQFHADTNPQNWKCKDQNEAKTNNKYRKQDDISVTDHKHTHHKRNDPVKADKRCKTEKHRDLKNADANSADRMNIESCTVEPNNNERKYTESSNVEPNKYERKHRESSGREASYKHGKHRKSSDAEPNYKDKRHKESSDGEPIYKDVKYRKSSDAEPNYTDRIHKESNYAEPKYKDRKHGELSQTEPNYKYRKNRESSDAEPNYDNMKYRKSGDAEPSNKDRKHGETSKPICKDRMHKESRDAESNCKDMKCRKSSDAQPNYKDRKLGESSDPEPNYKDRKLRESSDAEPNYKDIHHKDSSVAEPNRKDRRHKESSDAEPNCKDRKPRESSDAEPNCKDRRNKETSDAERNYKQRKREESSDAEHSHKDSRKNKTLSDVEASRKRRKHEESSDAEPNYKDRKPRESSDAEPNCKDRKLTELSDAEPNRKDRRHKESCDAEPNCKDRKPRESCDAEPNCKDRKPRESCDAEPNCKDRRRKESSDAEPNYKDRKHRESSDAEPNYKQRKREESSDAEHRHKDSRKNKTLSDVEASRKGRKHEASSDTEPNYKDRKHKESGDVEIRHKHKKHKKSRSAEPNCKTIKHNKPFDKYGKHKELCDARHRHKSAMHKYLLYANSIHIDEKDKFDRRHGESSSAHSFHAQQNNEASTVSYSLSFSNARKYPLKTHSNNKISLNQTELFVQTETNTLPDSHSIFHDNPRSRHDQGRQEIAEHPCINCHCRKKRKVNKYSVISDEDASLTSKSYQSVRRNKCQVHKGPCFKCASPKGNETNEQKMNYLDQCPKVEGVQENKSSPTCQSLSESQGFPRSPHDQGRQEIAEHPCINCHCRKKRKVNKYSVISDEDASLTSKSYQSVRRNKCQVHKGPCFKCASPKGNETNEQKMNYLDQCPKVEGVQENKSSPTCQSLSESQGFPRKLSTTSASQRERKHQINTAQPQPCKWQPEEIYPHFHSSDSSQLQISSNSLCQDNGKPCPSRNPSPEFFSNSFSSSSVFNGYPKCQTKKHLPAFCSQCQNLAYQCDSYMGLHTKQLSSQLCQSLSQCVDSTPNELSESSRGAGSSRTDLCACSFNLCNLIPCRTCSQIKGDLRRQNCCQISSTSEV